LPGRRSQVDLPVIITGKSSTLAPHTGRFKRALLLSQ
jgi:hypothetical protein